MIIFISGGKMKKKLSLVGLVLIVWKIFFICEFCSENVMLMLKNLKVMVNRVFIGRFGSFVVVFWFFILFVIFLNWIYIF